LSEFTIPMRWRDVDGLGHVNNAVVLTYLEEGRDRFLESLGINRSQYVVGRCSIEFNRELTLDSAPIAFSCVVTRIGSKSFETRETLRDAGGESAIEADCSLVMWNGEAGASRPLSETERAAFERSGEESR